MLAERASLHSDLCHRPLLSCVNAVCSVETVSVPLASHDDLCAPSIVQHANTVLLGNTNTHWLGC